MGAIASAVLQAVITKAAPMGVSKISKTKVGTNILGAGAVSMIDWNGVARKDPAAIGQLVIVGIGWITALYGRWRADQ